MRLLKECLLDEVTIDAEFLLDGVWYIACEHDEGSRIVQVVSDFYLNSDEVMGGCTFLEIGDYNRYRKSLTVIVEVL
jgi:hypothetical protein